MKALSVRTPWWWFILHGGKDIENRNWHTSFRGRVYIHASTWWRPGEVLEDFQEAAQICGDSGWKGTIPSPNCMRDASGCIVGSVEIADCVSASNSPWFCGDYGFLLRNPISFAAPVPCKGALGFFTLSSDVERNSAPQEKAGSQ